MRRRSFLGLIGTAAVWPWGTLAQSRPIKRVGMLMYTSESDPKGVARASTFVETLRQLGWFEGLSIKLEYRWTDGDPQLARTFASDLVAGRPNLLIASSTQTLSALQKQTSDIPIVFTQVSDPVSSGFVSSLGRPSSNITGFQNTDVGMGGKWIELLHNIDPRIKNVIMLLNPDTESNYAFVDIARGASGLLNIGVDFYPVRKVEDFYSMFNYFPSTSSRGIIALPNPVTVLNSMKLISLCAYHRVPVVYPYRYFAEEGGLVSYGPDQLEQWRGAARYVDRILRGESPGLLPVQAPTKFELAINLKTAKTLGLEVPPSLLARADEVIE